MIDQKRWPPIDSIVSLTLFLYFSVAATGFAAEVQHIRLLGYCNRQGRPALQVVLKGDFAYVGHHFGTASNPLSGKMEPNGTSIVEGSERSFPRD